MRSRFKTITLVQKSIRFDDPPSQKSLPGRDDLSFMEISKMLRTEGGFDGIE